MFFSVKEGMTRRLSVCSGLVSGDCALFFDGIRIKDVDSPPKGNSPACSAWDRYLLLGSLASVRVFEFFSGGLRKGERVI